MLSHYSANNQSLIEDGIPPNDPKQLPKTFGQGKFDGVIGEECRFPEDWDYFHGWALGHREFCCQQKRTRLLGSPQELDMSVGIILPDSI